MMLLMASPQRTTGSKMKKLAWDLAFWGLLAFALYRQVPLWWKSNEQEGKSIEAFYAKDLSGEKVTLPENGKKTVFVLWATWCGPCHAQLAQFKKAVEDGSLPRERVVALSVGETIETVRAYREKELLPFTVLADPEGLASSRFSFSVTPTIVFVDERAKISTFLQGLSPLAVTRAKIFLN
jgi:peroxiredoxin